MADIRTEFVNGRAVKIVEEEEGDLRNYLKEGQEIEKMDEESRQKKTEELCGAVRESEDGETIPEGKETQRSPRDPDEPMTVEDGEAILDDTMKSRSTNSARANEDVVLAMMVANQAMAEAAQAAPTYVVHGARIACSMGSREARLVVPLDHGACLKEKPQMTDMDYAALENVKSFGNCFSVENPDMEQAAIDATNRYNEQKAQSGWGAVKSFFMGGPKTVDCVSTELQQGCVCACTPCFLSPWTEGHEKNQVDGQKALLRSGVLICQYGGVVRIISDGQEE